MLSVSQIPLYHYAEKKFVKLYPIVYNGGSSRRGKKVWRIKTWTRFNACQFVPKCAWSWSRELKVYLNWGTWYWLMMTVKWRFILSKCKVVGTISKLLIFDVWRSCSLIEFNFKNSCFLNFVYGFCQH